STLVVVNNDCLGADIELHQSVAAFLTAKCMDCHSGSKAEAGLDLEKLVKLGLQADSLKTWVKVHDRVQSGEMPPDNAATEKQRYEFAHSLFPLLVSVDQNMINERGRTLFRRMNRLEYENSLRDLFDAPWLQIKTMLPEDGELQRFNKVSEALDVSHVNLSRYMQAADFAIREVIAKQLERPASTTTRYYAREQSAFNRKVRFTVFNRSPERATFPLIEYKADTRVLNEENSPFTVGDADPDLREKESFGVVASSYEPIELRFSSFKAPMSGRYKLRFKGYTFWTAGEEKKWWRPTRDQISIGRRSEPVAVYAELPPRQLRRLGDFDFQIEPTVQELDVLLLQGETIRPDAVRLFRSRPSNWHNPLAEADGQPGVAFNYLEVEGPIHKQWPSAGHELLFDDLPLRPRVGEASNGSASNGADKMEVVSANPKQDVERLIRRVVSRAYRSAPNDDDIDRLKHVVYTAMEAGHSFQESMIAGYTAALCSPNFVCLQESVGRLDASELATRLSLFLCNTTPDASLRGRALDGLLAGRDALQQVTRQLLRDSRSSRFVNAFLDYWLDLRKINDTSPDELLYPDYYLDDSLVDSALMETQMFFAEVLGKNLPARTLIDSDFTYVNERLAKHYGLEPFQGALLRRVTLPKSSPRGGLLTQASVLKVTANGTTTSPVIRGAWINERILGRKIPPPPKSVPAIEPDTRGATTIRQQLEMHRADASCSSCHAKIDPVGFALESFDVAGGWRENYRSLGESGELAQGFGKNGQPFTFRKGPAIDSSGSLETGEVFRDILEFKKLLLNQERMIARNLLCQLLIYATGAPPRFSDRVEIEQILDRWAPDHFPVRSLIEEVVCSPMFLNK
ncbi:MAG: DUF1588 domain-containing protein, partial [Pirellula sp.]